MPKMNFRLALDLGANSLGWCIYRLQDDGEISGLVRLGSRIFSDGRDPKSLASLAADRRMARQMRRRRDRVLKRRRRLIAGLVRYGLMPADEAARKSLQSSDPYVLRARALKEPLTPHEIGRALFHLARRRGFRSSRKEASSAEAEKETGKVKEAIQRLRSEIAAAGCTTVGEYLAKRHAERQPVRARRSQDGQYVLYLQRDMVADEFDRIWESQRHHHPSLLSDEARDYLRDTLLFQRRLLAVRPGRCLFEPGEYRAPLCSPLQQRFRILQELNNLRVKEGISYRAITLDERNRMLALLEREKGLVTFSKLAKAAGLGRAAAFNLESEKRKGLKGDSTSAQFAAPEAFGTAWLALPEDAREGIALLVERIDQEATLREALKQLPAAIDLAVEAVRPFQHELRHVQALACLPAPLTGAQIEAICRIRLPDDFGSLSHKALGRIVRELERDVVTYDVSVQRAGYQHHSQLHTGEFFQRLPYYGEVLRGYTAPADKAGDPEERAYGKIPNPTVHIGLNQLRLLVNAVIRRFGHPEQIVIELTRDFGVSGEKRRELEKRQAENQQRNERYDAELDRLGQRVNRENRLRLQLWEELGHDDALDRYCVYSGQRLNKTMLFSDEVEIDHILPFSRSLHDGIGNKVLCVRQANRDKRNMTPFEAFGHSPGAYRWDDILERVERLFARSSNRATRRKAELFRPDALEAFLEGRDFLERHLTDTAYLTRAARQYLSYICHKDQVWVSSGKLTGLLRGKWGLNSLLSDDKQKNRNDHRHHALDAAVIGTCSRSLIQRVATAAARAEGNGEHRLLDSLDLPWPGFRDELREALRRVIVSHRPDHGSGGALHNETNYGWRGEPDARGNPLVGRHVPLESLKGVADLDGIPEGDLRRRLLELLRPLSSAKEIKAALAEFARVTGVRRILKEERLAVIPIRHRQTGQPYRYVKGDGNYCYDIYSRSDGSWTVDLVSRYDANRDPAFDREGKMTRSGTKLILRLRRNDMIALREGERTRILRVASFSTNGVALAEHFEANVDSRDRDRRDDFHYTRKSPEPLRKAQARVVGVDVLGYVNDPGFRE